LDFRGWFEGLGGANIIYDGTQYVVVDVAAGSVAAGAGVLPGAIAEDLVVEGVEQGPPRVSRLRMTQVLGENRQEITFDFSPEVSEGRFVQTVLPGGQSYLRFDQFEAQTGDAIATAISACSSAGLILDLRHNTGGDPTAHSAIAGALIGPGRLLYRSIMRREDERLIVSAARPAVCTAPVAVLIGPATASSAEILADALRHYGRAVLVGDRTAGAVLGGGSFPLPDGGRITVPASDIIGVSGVRLEGVGVTPDIAAAASPVSLAAGVDAVLQAGVEALP
jgi:carboxyl-terminal processing protease